MKFPNEKFKFQVWKLKFYGLIFYIKIVNRILIFPYLELTLPNLEIIILKLNVKIPRLKM